MPKRYPLLRRIEDPPFTRYACTLIEDATAPDGYRIEDGDPEVMDAPLVHTIREAMKQPARTMRGGTKDGISWDEAAILYPSDPGYIAAAVRQIPGTHLGAPR